MLRKREASENTKEIAIAQEDIHTAFKISFEDDEHCNKCHIYTQLF